MTPTPATWGPDSRRAAVSLRFAGLAAAGDEDAAVSPALPRLLSLLAERRLTATFFVDAATAASEPFALTMVGNAGHELGALLDERGASDGVLAAIEAAGRTAAGASGVDVDRATIAELGAHPSVRYLSAPGEGISMLGELVRISFDSAAATEPAVAAEPSAAVGERSATAGPHAWHPAMQLAVAGAVERHGHATLSFAPAALERGDALGAFAETLDLVSGLTRAGRLWVPALGDLADWWRTHSAAPNA